MNIIQPPTDSLYKFMAVSGLLILGFFVIWPELRLYELGQQTVQVVGEVNILHREVDHLQEDMVRLGKNKSVPEILIEKRRLLEIKLEQIGTKGELLELATTDMRRMIRVLYMGVVFGLILSFLGFILWYRKVQMWQDIAIRREALLEANNPQENKTNNGGNGENK